MSKYIKKTGIIQSNGYVLSEDNKLYKPDMIYNDTILLAMSSWSRYKIKDVVNKKVSFTVFLETNKAYNFELID